MRVPSGHIYKFIKMKTLIICIVGFLLPPLNSFGSIYYVSPGGNSTSLGTRDEPWSLDKANRSMLAGDTAILLDGTYTIVPIAPNASGNEGEYITYMAERRHGAVFQDINEVSGSNGPTAVFVNDKSYIAIEGIKVEGVKRWVVGVGSDHISLNECYFNGGSGWINCRFDEIGDGMKITGCYFSGGTDLLSLDGGDGHLVENNFFGDAQHTGLVLLGVQNSVIRNNTLNNRLWRNMEVESQRHEPYRHSKYNLIENNYFDFSPGTGSIQYAGNYSIIRRNIFSRALGGMKWANYLGSAQTPEAWHNAHNRFYNNVIAECGSNAAIFQTINTNKNNGIVPAENVSDQGFGMIIQTNLFNPPNASHPDSGNCEYGDNISVNNIFYKNSNTKYGKASQTSQISFTWNATPVFAEIYHNIIFSGTTGDDAFYFEDAVGQDPAQERNTTISELELLYPDNVYDNSDFDPQFIYASGRNYRLSDESSCIDQGTALTKTISDGTGTVISVQDAIWFANGYGLTGTDTIRINLERLAVIGVDYDLNTITVNKELSWKQDDEVFFDFKDDAPDFGAFEYGTKYTVGADISVFEPEIPTGLNEYERFGLHGVKNYPNPFKNSTVIEFELDKPGDILVEIFDVSGTRIKTLKKGNCSTGIHIVEWNGEDNNMTRASPGMYLCRMSFLGMPLTTTKITLLQ